MLAIVSHKRSTLVYTHPVTQGPAAAGARRPAAARVCWPGDAALAT
jgi:hypothetical protein